MKKGCFLSSVIIFTLIVGVIVYTVKYKKDIFKNFSKTKIMEMALSDYDKKLEDAAKNVYRDSLKSELHDFFVKNKEMEFDSAMSRMQSVVTRLNEIIKDKYIDSLEYQKFKNFVEHYEGSKKDRN